MSQPTILLLGNPALYEKSTPIKQEELETLPSVIDQLHETMMNFREQYKRGRAIAAPQIGVMKRLLYMHIDKPVVFINPTFTYKSPELIELWDDCMSFPDLLVKVRRHAQVTLTFKDMNWHDQEWKLTGDLSELLQHEYDHLDGILAVQRAIDNKSFALYNQKQFIQFDR
jgi:peptide deformylase